MPGAPPGNGECGGYIGLAAYNSQAQVGYITSGSANATTQVVFTAKFSADTLLRYSFVAGGSDGAITISNKDKTRFWFANEATRSVDLVPIERAMRFTMYASEAQDALLLKTGRYFVSMAQGNNGSLALVQTLSTSAFLRAPPQQSASLTAAAVQKQVDQSDAVALGYRYNALKSKASKVATQWLAYDLALVIPLALRFNQFTMENATRLDLDTALEKTFSLITDKMALEYGVKYASLGKKLPSDFQLSKVAAGIRTQPADSVWRDVATRFLKAVGDATKLGVDSVGRSAHFAAAVFAQAKLNDFQDRTSVFLSPGDTEGASMAAYFTSSCALAWQSSRLKTLAAKVNATEIIVNRFNTAELTKEDPNAVQTFWFSSISNPGNSPRVLNSSLLLVELGLLKHLDATFLRSNGAIGESISRPLFTEIDAALGSSKGMDLDRIYKLVSDTHTREVMNVVDTLCRKTGGNSTSLSIEINLCVLPQLFRQAGVFSMNSRKVEDPDVLTDLKTGASVSYVQYLKLVQSDRNVLAIRSELQSAKTEFVTTSQMFTDGLTDTISDSAVTQAIESSKEIASTTSSLATYLAKGSNFNVQGLNAKLTQKLTAIEDSKAKVQGKKTRYLTTLKRLGTKAQIRAVVEAVVAVISTVFSVVNAVDSFSTGGSKDVGGSVGSVISSLKTAVAAIEDTADVFELKSYLSEVATEFNNVLSQMVKALPAIEKVRSAAAPLTDTSKNVPEAQLAASSEAFLVAVREYTAPVSEAQLNSLQVRFASIGEKFCTIAQMPSDQDCVDIRGDNTLIFGSMVEVVQLTSDAMQLLVEQATEAVNDRTLTMLTDTVAKNEKETTGVSLDALKKQWGDDKRKRSAWWFQWRKQQSYLSATSAVGSVLNQVYLLSSLVEKCDRETYLSGGRASDTCNSVVYSGLPISDASVSRLISLKSDAGDHEVVKDTGMVPTAPSYSGDLAFIDLQKLMDSQSVIFQLPANNASWLLKHEWISQQADLESYVFYVKKLTLKLPPRFASYASEASQVEILVSSMGTSLLGPAAQGKAFVIPTRQFKTEYTQSPTSSASSSSCASVEYQNCAPKIPVYCYRSLGVSDAAAGGLNPTLFSEWSVRASFAVSDKGDAKKISYRAVVSPSLLYVDYELEKVPVGDARRRLRRRLALSSSSSPSSAELRKRTLQSTRCCPVGSYQHFVGDELGCLKCPQQSVSQLGGLFCSRVGASKTATSVSSDTAETSSESGAGGEADSGSSAAEASGDGA